MTEMTTVEHGRLERLEEVVERGLATFVEVGQALLEIRDSRLYRAAFGTFEDYCRDRWGMSRRNANRIIESAGVAASLGPMGPIPANERQARELAPLRDDPDAMRAAWEEASADGEPTAEKVREAVNSRLGVHYSSATDMWATPQALFDQLDAEFGFTLDVCATVENAKCTRFFTETDDGLAQDWADEVCWMNPPYGEAIPAWVRKAREASLEGATVVCLVPARTDTGWWWDHCRHGQVRFLRGRLRFGDGVGGAPFPSAVVVFRLGRPARTVYWDRDG